MADSPRRSAPATYRNREPILGVLRTVLPAKGRVLEVASGTGEHACYFAHHLPGVEWQPSDPTAEACATIAAWAQDAALPNLAAPIALDAAHAVWPVEQAAAVVCINMVHISPWEATVGLMRGAGRILPRGGPLCLYGPFRRGDRPLEPGNAAFDADLRERNPAWGLRALDEVIACAAAHDLVFERLVEMPANNLSVVFRKA